MPNNKTVKVKYKAQQDPPISFPGGGNVEMDAAGTITFEQAQGSDPFTFTNLTITPASAQFSVTSTGASLVLQDNDTTAGTYNYCVDITAGGNPYSSDPQIVNKT